MITSYAEQIGSLDANEIVALEAAAKLIKTEPQTIWTARSSGSCVV